MKTEDIKELDIVERSLEIIDLDTFREDFYGGEEDNWACSLNRGCMIVSKK